MSESEDMPKSPLSPLVADAIATREIVEAWIQAGFTEEQAFAMILKVLECQIMRGGQ
jgi:hypothetical protein